MRCSGLTNVITLMVQSAAVYETAVTGGNQRKTHQGSNMAPKEPMKCKKGKMAKKVFGAFLVKDNMVIMAQLCGSTLVVWFMGVVPANI